MTKLRQAHTHHLGSSNSPTSSTDTIIQEGLVIARDIACHSEVIIVDLLTQLALVKRVSCGDCNETVAMLLEAITASSALNIDHVLTYTMYCVLSEVLARQACISKQNVSKNSVPPSRSSEQRRKISQQGSRTSSFRGSVSPREDRGKVGSKEGYQAWCALKTASVCQESQEKLYQFSLELHNEEMNRQLSNKLLLKLPDFILMDLFGSKDIVTSLLHNADVPSIESLLPSAQSANPKGLTWFTLIGYLHTLLQQGFWSTAITKNWGLRTHTLSHKIIPKLQSIFMFLQSHCPPFSKYCTLPKPPSPLSMIIESSDVESRDSIPHSSYVEALPFLTATEGEVSVIWYSSQSSNTSSKDVLYGLFSLNSKPIKSILMNTHSMCTSGAEVHMVTTHMSHLSQLRLVWEELANHCNSFLNEQLTRPLSRSPSRMRKKSMEMARQGTPPELQVCVFILMLP